MKFYSGRILGNELIWDDKSLHFSQEELKLIKEWIRKNHLPWLSQVLNDEDAAFLGQEKRYLEKEIKSMLFTKEKDCDESLLQKKILSFLEFAIKEDIDIYVVN